MSSSIPYKLQRQTLRLRLQANRLILTQETTSDQLPTEDDEFPRSITMRILSSTPGIATFLLAEVTPFLLGRYLAKRKRKRKKSGRC